MAVQIVYLNLVASFLKKSKRLFFAAVEAVMSSDNAYSELENIAKSMRMKYKKAKVHSEKCYNNR